MKNEKIIMLFHKDMLIAATTSKKTMKKFIKTRQMLKSDTRSLKLVTRVMSEEEITRIENHLLLIAPINDDIVMTQEEAQIALTGYQIFREDVFKSIQTLNSIYQLSGNKYSETLYDTSMDLCNYLDDDTWMLEEFLLSFSLFTVPDVKSYYTMLKNLGNIVDDTCRIAKHSNYINNGIHRYEWELNSNNDNKIVENEWFEF